MGGIPGPIVISFCIAGEIEILGKSVCPDVRGIQMNGSCTFRYEVALDFWVCMLVFQYIELGFAAGMEWTSITAKCWWTPVSAKEWWRRRRRVRSCNWKKACDIYVKGWVSIVKFLITKITLEFVYWCKSKVLKIYVHLHAWAWKWHEAWSSMIYNRKFR